VDLVAGERILWQGRPSWRAHLSYFVVWIPLALLPVIVAGALRANDSDTGLPYWQWILISVALVVLVVAWDAVRRLATFYMVTNQRLRVRRGILARREQTARFDRIQNVNIAQSLVDRVMHVGAVDFDTAGSGEEQEDFRFEGIADPQRLVRIVAEHSHPPHGAPTAGL
jgi:uncharacterized membrane protein YdbT with pleckstrin-like domain